MDLHIDNPLYERLRATVGGFAVMTKIGELLPCPFCGGDAHISEFDISGVGRRTQVQCANDDGCPVCVDVQKPDRSEAIGAWNTRAAPAQTHPQHQVWNLLAKHFPGDQADKIVSIVAPYLRPAQPTREPVAWRWKDLRFGANSSWIYVSHEPKYENIISEPLFTLTGEVCTCGGDAAQLASHHDISCPKALEE